MLFSPAVCGGCGAAFASGVVVAERPGVPVSYRGTAGPCPGCGGRGRIPGWIFRFHGAAAAARDQASAAENVAVLRAVRDRASQPCDAASFRAFTRQLSGTWRGVAVQLGGIPPGERVAALAMLGRMLADRVQLEPAVAGADFGATTSGEPGTRGATRTPMSA